MKEPVLPSIAEPLAEKAAGLPLPVRRCLIKEQAAEYLAIGVTLLLEVGPPPIKIGRRSVWDVVDLDAWVEEYKGRGRAGKDGIDKWPVKLESTDGEIPGTGGSSSYYRTASEYARALGLKTEKKHRPCSTK